MFKWWIVILLPLVFGQSGLGNQAGLTSQPPSGVNKIAVTTFSDDTDRNGNCSLREAIQAANLDQAVDACRAGSGADLIQLKAGEYRLSLGETEEDANQSGDLDLTSSLTLRGAGPGATRLNAAGLDRALHLLAPEAQVTLQGLSLTGGRSRDLGGAIWNQGHLLIQNASLEDNFASEAGGAIFNQGFLRAENSRICRNQSENLGGGISNQGTLELFAVELCDNNAVIWLGQGGGALENRGQALIQNSRLTGNAGMGGGAILNFGRLRMEYVTLSGSVTRHAGGALAQEALPGSEEPVAELESVRFLENPAGGLVQTAGWMTLKDSTVDNAGLLPAEELEAGGVLLTGGTLRIENSTISHVGPAFGAAVRVSGGTLGLSNSTISGNSTRGLAQLGGTASLYSSTLTDNLGVGFALSGGYLSVTNSLIAANRAGPDVTGSDVSGSDVSGPDVSGPDCAAQPGAQLTSQGSNLIGWDGCAFPAHFFDQIGSAEAPLDPLLAPLADNGGLTQTHALLPDSPARDAADSCPPSDQRGLSRLVLGDCDTGAFEFGGSESGGDDLSALAIDIGPFDLDNISGTGPGGSGRVRVALLNWAGSEAVGTPDPADVTIGFGRYGTEDSLILKGPGLPDCRLQDVNADGLPDLVCEFRLARTQLMTECGQGGAYRTLARLSLRIGGRIWLGSDELGVPACP